MDSAASAVGDAEVSEIFNITRTDETTSFCFPTPCLATHLCIQLVRRSA